MDSLTRFELAVEQLKSGNQQFSFEIDDDFFAALEVEDIQKGSLKATICTQKLAENIEMHIKIDGEITISCDRCLDDMQQPIHVDEMMLVRFGNEADEDENGITITPDTTSINIAWNLYESIALAIPIMHTHADGECNEEMMAKFREHTIDENATRQETDPRWDALKNISNNN